MALAPDKYVVTYGPPVAAGETQPMQSSLYGDSDITEIKNKADSSLQESYLNEKLEGVEVLKGSFNPTTETPDIENATTGIKKGETYLVSEAGSFFTSAVKANTKLIALQDNPVQLSHWRIEVLFTAAEVKAQYEANSNTNAFTDADKSKLEGIEAGAKGELADTEVKSKYEANSNTNVFTDAEKAKLAGIEAEAKGDLTDAEIKSKYEANSNTNVFTDSEKSKLASIDENASDDMTAAEVKVRYEINDNTNVFTDSEKASLANLNTGGSILKWEVATGSSTAASLRTGYFIDTSSQTHTLTLPASPVIGEEVAFSDFKKNAEVNNITIDRNGNKIDSDEEDLIVEMSGVTVTLTYTGADVGWFITNFIQASI